MKGIHLQPTPSTDRTTEANSAVKGGRADERKKPVIDSPDK